jgi:hypothetical protein
MAVDRSWKARTRGPDVKANIFDRTNRVIGWTVEDSHRVAVYDATGRMLGFYVKSSDTTHDAASRFVGRGNQVLRLLK